MIPPSECIRLTTVPSGPLIHVTVHRFEETIGGRSYLIEVRPVANRWRAHLQRAAGVPTAMMPFYGPTPHEAARQLAQWLTLAHKRMAGAKADAAAVSSSPSKA